MEVNFSQLPTSPSRNRCVSWLDRIRKIIFLYSTKFFDEIIRNIIYAETSMTNDKKKIEIRIEIFSKSNFIFQTVTKNLYGLTKVLVFSLYFSFSATCWTLSLLRIR